MVGDAVFSGELRTSLLKTMQSGTIQVPKTSWQRQALWHKVPIWLACIVVRILLGLVGYAEQQ